LQPPYAGTVRFELADPVRVRVVPGAAGFGSIAITPHADHVVISGDRITEAAVTSVRVGGVRQVPRGAGDTLAAIQTARPPAPRWRYACLKGALLVTGSA
jgi:hypothetical protein